MRDRPTLTNIDAQKIMAAAKAEAAKNKWAVSIAIVDDGGNLMLFERLDGASSLSTSVAVGKAQASAASGMPSGVMGNFIKEMPGALKLPIGLPIQGAVPLVYKGERVGAVGASGVKAEEDEQIAAAGAKAL